MVMLGVMLVVGLGIIGYVFREKLMPEAIGSLTVASPAERIELPDFRGSDMLFKRRDFKELQRFGEVPVRPEETPPKSPFQ